MVESEKQAIPQVSSKQRWFKKRWVVIASAMLVVNAGALGWVYMQNQARAEAKQYLQERDIYLHEQQYGWAWYQSLATKLPLPKFKRAIEFQYPQFYISRIYGPFSLKNDLNDDDWAALSQFPHISRWVIVNTRITDKDLSRMAQHWPDIKSITLRGNQISEEGWGYLTSLDQLEALELSDTYLTDDTLSHLANLPLKVLGLSNNSQLTDAGLVHLTSLTQLRSLDVNGTHVTREKVTELLPWVGKLDIGTPVIERDTPSSAK